MSGYYTFNVIIRQIYIYIHSENYHCIFKIFLVTFTTFINTPPWNNWFRFSYLILLTCLYWELPPNLSWACFKVFFLRNWPCNRLEIYLSLSGETSQNDKEFQINMPLGSGLLYWKFVISLLRRKKVQKKYFDDLSVRKLSLHKICNYFDTIWNIQKKKIINNSSI